MNHFDDLNSKEQKPMDHDYDGIQEFDNPLPNWWLMTFLGTIVFSFIYFIHYTYGGGQTQSDELKQELALLPKTTEKSWDENDLMAKLNDPDITSKGQAVFNSKCSSCHGQKGEGVIGPNLTDRFWIHGKGLRKDIAQVVAKGVLDKGMPAWSGLISDDEILAVTGYVYAIQGTQTANGKAPQGVEVTN